MSLPEGLPDQKAIEQLPPLKRLRHSDYTIGWICALPIEHAFVMLDEYHEKLPAQRHDPTYVLGRIDVHNVVLACLPTMGLIAAAQCASRLQYSFTSLRFLLLVGIGGGVPTRHDVRLGDVVIGIPGKLHRGVMQYDFGTRFQQQDLTVRDTQISAPPDVLLTAVTKLDTLSAYEQGAKIEERLGQYVANLVTKFPTLEKCKRPAEDHLFKPKYRHKDDESPCDQCACDLAEVQLRPPRPNAQIPRIHKGLIASGSEVMRDAIERDRLSMEHDILCFEMEAAGLASTSVGFLVIRGICDYSDSHKNKVWQPYAAAVAAAYARELLHAIPGVMTEQDVSETTHLKQEVATHSHNVDLTGRNDSVRLNDKLQDRVYASEANRISDTGLHCERCRSAIVYRHNLKICAKGNTNLLCEQCLNKLRSSWLKQQRDWHELTMKDEALSRPAKCSGCEERFDPGRFWGLVKCDSESDKGYKICHKCWQSACRSGIEPKKSTADRKGEKQRMILLNIVQPPRRFSLEWYGKSVFMSHFMDR